MGNGGACIEGFEVLAECPNFADLNGEDVKASRSAVKSLDDAVGTVSRALFSGKALTAEEGHQIAGECGAKVVMLMGMVKSGKTTVLSELYERFCQGRFAGYCFAGSRTIMGFERVCYLSRAVSEGEVEDTERTKRGREDNLLHLDLVAGSGQVPHRLLISDLSGEVFEDAIKTNENLYEIPYLRRADHLVVFADAERLGQVSERQHVANQLLVLLRCCTEESRIAKSCRLTVVVSRHDLLPSDMDQAFLESMRTRIRRRTDDYFYEPVRFLDLAARPANGPTNAYGLGELLGLWLDDTPTLRPRLPNLVCSFDDAAREIDTFAFKAVADDE